jgi:hypothetical protein
MQKRKTIYGVSYHKSAYNSPSPNNPQNQSTQGFERLDSILARIAEIPEIGLTGQSAVQSDIGLGELKA